MSTKIEWCDITWNPVWGCENNCAYCYAHKMAKRFANKKAIKELTNYPHNLLRGSADTDIEIEKLTKRLKQFKPTWLESNFQKAFPKKPSRIFVDSMSDIAFWEIKWLKDTLNKIDLYRQHTFIFLTKEPEVYFKYKWPTNCILGVTITNMNMFWANLDFMGIHLQNKVMYSFEPIQEKIDLDLFSIPDWVIIGAETGNRKDKIIPQRKWIELLLKQCEEKHIPLFMKDNLKSVWGEKLIQEWPE